MIDRLLTGTTLWLLWIVRRIISLDRRAYMLLSATMDLVVTQAVDGVKGIHALVPKAIFQK